LKPNTQETSNKQSICWSLPRTRTRSPLWCLQIDRKFSFNLNEFITDSDEKGSSQICDYFLSFTNITFTLELLPKKGFIYISCFTKQQSITHLMLFLHNFLRWLSIISFTLRIALDCLVKELSQGSEMRERKRVLDIEKHKYKCTLYSFEKQASKQTDLILKAK